jgi:deoxyribose-phosphate aldolase
MNIRTKQQLAATIEHTLLSPTATGDDIRRLCQEARTMGFCAVCINPRWVSLAADILAGSAVKIVSVVGFPLGAEITKIKVAETKEVIFAGADEVDMVVDLAAVVQSDERYLATELMEVLKVCRIMKPPVILKAIVEAAALTDEQKRFVCRVANQVDVDFIKTSTGFHPAGGASIEDVKLIKETAPRCRVKAAGGIRTAQQTLDFLAAGAERIGTSAGPAILEQFEPQD